jgi:hypothetical protein
VSSPFRILFIGNSYTSRNQMPTLLQKVAEGSGLSQPVETHVLAFGGASLAAHWNKGIAQAMLSDQTWDAVVLQDQSTRPIRAAKSMQEYGRRFAQAAHSAGARPCLYVTWARQDQPQSQPIITSAYRELAKETAALPIPVGPAWEQLHRLHPELALYDADRSHPSFAGSYLSACVFCASLFGKKPKGIDTETVGVTEENADIIHEIAWRTATEFSAESRP